MTTATTTTLSSVMPLLLLQMVVAERPVSMLISFEGNPDFLFNANFYNDTFKQFYVCMAGRNVLNCNLELQTDFKYPYNKTDRLVLNVGKVSATNSPIDDNYFSCKHFPNINKIICQRSTQRNGSESLCQTFRLTEVSYKTACVTIFWSFPKERLLYNNLADIDDCSVSSSPSICPVVTPSTSSAIPTDDVSNAKTDNNVPVIVGVICAVLVLVITVIVVIFLWRRRQRHKGHNSASTDNRQHGTVDHKKGANISSKISKIPNGAFTDTEGRTTEVGDLDNGYYTLDSKFTTRKNENPSVRSHGEISEESRKRTTLGTVIDQSEDGYTYMKGSDRVPGEGCYSMGNISLSSTDDYSLAQYMNSSEVATTNPETFYSRLGEHVTVKVNPYNSLLGSNDCSCDQKPNQDGLSNIEVLQDKHCGVDDISINTPSLSSSTSSCVGGGRPAKTSTKDLPEYSTLGVK